MMYKNKQQTMQETLKVIISFLLMLMNTWGTLYWFNLYKTGEYTEWWIYVILITCGLAALIFAFRFAKAVREWLF